VKSHKIANNSQTTEAREKISIVLESVKFKKFFDICIDWLNLKTIEFFLMKLATDFYWQPSHYLLGGRASFQIQTGIDINSGIDTTGTNDVFTNTQSRIIYSIVNLCSFNTTAMYDFHQMI
jgi:hypothetical protein